MVDMTHNRASIADQKRTGTAGRFGQKVTSSPAAALSSASMTAGARIRTLAQGIPGAAAIDFVTDDGSLVVDEIRDEDGYPLLDDCDIDVIDIDAAAVAVTDPAGAGMTVRTAGPGGHESALTYTIDLLDERA